MDQRGEEITALNDTVSHLQKMIELLQNKRGIEFQLLVNCLYPGETRETQIRLLLEILSVQNCYQSPGALLLSLQAIAQKIGIKK